MVVDKSALSPRVLRAKHALEVMRSQNSASILTKTSSNHYIGSKNAVKIFFSLLVEEMPISILMKYLVSSRVMILFDRITEFTLNHGCPNIHI